MPKPLRRTIGAALAAATLSAAVASGAGAQLRDGFRSTLADPGDDSWSAFQDFGFDVNIRGGTYRSAGACMNGILSLGVLDNPVVCPYPGSFGFFAPPDPGSLPGFGAVYGTAVLANFRDLTSDEDGSGRLGWGGGTVDGRQAFGFTWDGVFSYNTTARNYFQVLFIDRSADFGAGAFDLEFNNQALGPRRPIATAGLAGVADDGGFSGTPYSVRVGGGRHSRYVLCFRDGTADLNACPVVNLVPEPSTVALTLVGFGALTAAVRRRRTA